MTKPLFQPGMSGEIGGIQWRVDEGTKGPGDMVILIRTTTWVKPKQALTFLLADFHDQVEDILYPPSRGFLGGQMFRNYVRGAFDVGWEWPADIVENQRETSSRRMPVASSGDDDIEWGEI